MTKETRMTNDSSSKFVADAASVRQQIPIAICTDAGSVGHDRGNLELLNHEAATKRSCPDPGFEFRHSFVIACFVISQFLATSLAFSQDAAPSRVVIPFDFESKFDDSRYGKIVGDMIWKKLDRDGGFIIPESMLDVRDWSERRNALPNDQTSLEQMKEYVVEDFGANVGVWGKVERVAGFELDVYDLWIKIADFSGAQPQMIHETKARTKTASEIPHLYVKQALDKLYGRGPGVVAQVDADAEKRWAEGPNLVMGDFDKGNIEPLGWDPLPQYVTRVPLPDDSKSRNQVVRFQFPTDVAATTGVLYYSDYFPVEEGATHRFQCRWRTTGSAVKVFIKCYDELPGKFRASDPQAASSRRREVYRSQQNLTGPAKTWNVQTEDFTPKHTQFSPKWGRVMLYAYWPAGAVDWDDVIVKQIKPSPTNQDPKVRRPSLETKVLSEEVDAAK